MATFEIGRVYHRQSEIHGVYKGQKQGGISTPTETNDVFIFTGDAGHQHGYVDRPLPDGTFLYYGEGQVGDMQMVRGNAALPSTSPMGRNSTFLSTSERPMSDTWASAV
jgi:5-methylcytosine-specific restriction enzyme A